MARRPPSPIDRFFSSLRDALLDTAEDILDDAEDVFRAKFQPPAYHNPPNSPRPGKQSSGRSRQSPRPKAQGRSTASPGASLRQEMTLYGVLGVREDAPQEVIQGAWKALCRVYHPDTGFKGDPEKIKSINSAYEVLSDPKRREKYDRTIGISRGK